MGLHLLSQQHACLLLSCTAAANAGVAVGTAAISGLAAVVAVTAALIAVATAGAVVGVAFGAASAASRTRVGWCRPGAATTRCCY